MVAIYNYCLMNVRMKTALVIHIEVPRIYFDELGFGTNVYIRLFCMEYFHRMVSEARN